jgi:poly(3-hydroxybutyrate) depolymerase
MREALPVAAVGAALLLSAMAALASPAAGGGAEEAGIAAGAHFLPTIEDTIRVAEWRYLGPFSAGYREGIESLPVWPGTLAPDMLRRKTSLGKDEYRSILTPGGTVTWRTVRPDSTGWTLIEFEEVLWDTIMDIYGYAGLVNKTYAYAEIEAPFESRALIIAERIGTFFLNWEECPGGLYGHGYVRVPVVLKQGRNRVLLSLSGFAGHRFKFELIPAEAPLMLLDDYTTPDLIENETGRAWMGVAILNTTARTIDRALLEIGGGGVIGRREMSLAGLAPLCVKKVPVEMEIKSPPRGMEEVRISVSVSLGGEVFRDSVSLRVRRPDQSAKRTFISSMDNSCQYYAVLPPEDYDPERKYALILTLHGAGVRAEGQVDAYKPKSWAFVVAPTNRRPFGFDWQDWGRLDALEVLREAVKTLPVDTTRIYLTGHSMGGHGAWHVGLNHPDLFAAMAPEAGWTSFELYIPWFLQKSYIYGDPRAVAMRDLSLRQDKPLNFVENARNLPVYILHGGSDDNVPVIHGRMFAGRLEGLGYEYEYNEMPGRGHWWHDDSLDVSCVDYPEVMDFLASHTREDHPDIVSFRTVNLGTSNQAYWIRIDAQEKPMTMTEINAHSLGHVFHSLSVPTITIETQNVREFTLAPGHLMGQGPFTVSIDGEEQIVNLPEDGMLTLTKRAGRFRPGPAGLSGLVKTPDLYGPIKQAYFSPFVLVYGTKSGTWRFPAVDVTLPMARSQAMRWWRRGNGCVNVVPDTCVTDSMTAACNLILFGGPLENRITARIQRDLPIRVKRGAIEIGGHLIEGRGLAARFIYPNPLNPERFVVVHAGGDVGGLRLSDTFKTMHAGAGLPDYIIFDSRAVYRGWAGVLATGFFDSDWEVDPGLMYLAPR